ncbi:helix-hairpin-helix domain-containing protein [Pseudomonas sp. 65/3-MNA-CIBAN-0223]|uniref:ComEA family DNA-binding protein n=1 Tax=Pseudomonas sp. 65/3-MNA-CIBAN-0223 TaxID=3140476 RepID=UPI003324D01C
MRTGYFSSLVFALLTSLSLTTHAAPAPKAETAAPSATQQIAPDPQAPKVQLNKADAITLQRDLIGVGEAKAQDIVAYRDMNGPFATVDELLEVKGIGKAILDKNRERLVVN